MKTLGYSPWGNGHSPEPFDQLFDGYVDCFEKGMQGIDAFILWGGTDIHPSLYGAKRHGYNGAPPEPSTRDLWEWQALKYCKAHNIPTIGVCRGAQMQCAFAGGKLFQHVTGHTSGHHMMTTSTGEDILTTSAHHQMLDLTDTEHELLAWSKKAHSTCYYAEESQTPKHVDMATFKEPEVVFFPTIRGLAIQGHPEWSKPDSLFAKYCLNLVSEYLFDEVWT
jgi:GMP synthase-like glutamine amidotransferase